MIKTIEYRQVFLDPEGHEVSLPYFKEKSIEYYQVFCDRCGGNATGGTENSSWSEPDFAREWAHDADWICIDDDKDYCPDCWEWAEDEETPIPKPPIEKCREIIEKSTT